MIQPFSAWSGALAALLGECAQAAAALPLVMLLTIMIGRRSHLELVQYGFECLRRLTLCLALPGLFGFLLPVLLILGRWPHDVTLASLFHPVILPWTLASLAWLAAFVWLAIVRLSAICSCLVPLFLALAALVLSNWPFAGLPQGMDSATVFAVLALQAGHRLFLGLSLAGGLALVLVHFWESGFVSSGEGNRAGARRWLSFWACLGAVPFLVDRWGIVIGNLLRQSASSAVDSLLARLVPLSIAVFCWAVLLALPGDQAAGKDLGGKRSGRARQTGERVTGAKSGFATGLLRLTRLDPVQVAWLGLGLAVAGIVLQALFQHGIFRLGH